MSEKGLSREPLIRPAQASQLIAAARVLRDLYEDGYIDNQPGLDNMADRGHADHLRGLRESEVRNRPEGAGEG